MDNPDVWPAVGGDRGQQAAIACSHQRSGLESMGPGAAPRPRRPSPPARRKGLRRGSSANRVWATTVGGGVQQSLDRQIQYQTRRQRNRRAPKPCRAAAPGVRCEQADRETSRQRPVGIRAAERSLGGDQHEDRPSQAAHSSSAAPPPASPAGDWPRRFASRHPPSTNMPTTRGEKTRNCAPTKDTTLATRSPMPMRNPADACESSTWCPMVAKPLATFHTRFGANTGERDGRGGPGAGLPKAAHAGEPARGRRPRTAPWSTCSAVQGPPQHRTAARPQTARDGPGWPAPGRKPRLDDHIINQASVVANAA